MRDTVGTQGSHMRDTVGTQGSHMRDTFGTQGSYMRGHSWHTRFIHEGTQLAHKVHT